MPSPSIYRGECWKLYRPGEDARFKDAWISRRPNGELAAVQGFRQGLIDNCIMCQVSFIFPNPDPHNASVDELDAVKFANKVLEEELDKSRKELSILRTTIELSKKAARMLRQALL